MTRAGQWWCRLGLGLFSVVMLAQRATLARAQEAGVAAASALAVTDARVAQIRALLEGELDVSIDPQTLFDVPLEDPSAIEIETIRLQAVLRGADEATRPPQVLARGRKGGREPGDAGGHGFLESSRWLDRIELDRARFEFYASSAERRAELLRVHGERRAAALSRESREERRAREAEEERQRALEAARQARSEAERLVSEELARLIATQERVRASRDGFRASRAELLSRRDSVLGWQRRIRAAKAASPVEADAIYDPLRRALRASRDDLSRALDALGSRATRVSETGPDPLGDIPVDVPTEHLRKRRRSVELDIAQARNEERSLREERAAELLEEIDILNRERLGLLRALSPHKRGAITGFTEVGWDQARSESRHLQLIIRYHLQATLRWLRSVRTGGPSGVSTWGVLRGSAPWLFLVLSFIWARPRIPVVLKHVERRIAETDRAERRPTPSPHRHVVRFLRKVQGPLVWLIFVVVAMWLVPAHLKSLLEVQLLSSVVAWVLGGALVVNAINALAAGSFGGAVDDGMGSGELRLRSLRLVGRTVVVLALVLVISSRLVGEGTVYRWVISTCWGAAFPIFLILVRWWRDTVFERIARVRKKTPVQAWVLANRTGWKSFLAAMLGAIQLFTLGAIKTIRNWLSEFDLARRAHAYLFRRELERLGEAGSKTSSRPLAPRSFEALSPDLPSTGSVAGPSDELSRRIAERVASGRGGLVAVVGGRGMGKSFLLRTLAERSSSVRRVYCGGLSTLQDVTTAVERGDGSMPGGKPSLVLLEDAHTLLKPVIGGLALFDGLVSFSRAHCSSTTWVFSIDAVMWSFLTRARDARPTFDEVLHLAPWTEDQIHALLRQRCEQAELAPSYEDLLEKLPPGADEIERLDALRDKEAGYVRMLWDHVRGNPGLALESWRTSLVEDEHGVVRVRPLQVVDSSELEALPDTSLFALRAVLQLAPADLSDVALATRLSEEQVFNAFRFGQMRGYFEEREGRVRITWRWLRPVLRLLERRHLLVSS